MIPKRTITIGAVGETGYFSDVNTGVRKHGYDWPFQLMQPHLRSVDLFFANMECVFLPPDYPKI